MYKQKDNWHSETWENLKKNPEVDLLVIGGGINGAGVLRDASKRGLKTLLVESHDFSWGTSSRSSKLVHGGLRYLENLEFGLVFESLQERQVLLEIAPHLVKPLRFVLPVYKDSRVSYFKLGLGMFFYDLLSYFISPHERRNLKQTKNRSKIISQKNLVGSFVYSDSYMDDTGLVLESLRDAKNFEGLFLNFVGVQKVFSKNDQKLEVIDSVELFNSLNNESLKIKAKTIISTLGPWTDLWACANLKKWNPCMRLSKGVHISFERDRLPIDEAIVLTDDVKKRIVFVIPRDDYLLVGTTDTEFNGDPGDVCPEAEDIDYLMAMLGQYFPKAYLQKKDIIGAYAGVRPLVKDDSSSVGATSRTHIIRKHGDNLYFLLGGKYTTYRKMAKDVLDRCIDDLKVNDKQRLKRCSTKEVLNKKAMYKQGSSKYLSDGNLLILEKNNISKKYFHILRAKYGAESKNFLQNYGFDWQKANEELSFRKLELRVQVSEYFCLSLYDFYVHRSSVSLSQKKRGFDYIDSLSSLMIDEFGFDKEQMALDKTKITKYFADTKFD